MNLLFTLVTYTLIGNGAGASIITTVTGQGTGLILTVVIADNVVSSITATSTGRGYSYTVAVTWILLAVTIWIVVGIRNRISNKIQATSNLNFGNVLSNQVSIQKDPWISYWCKHSIINSTSKWRKPTILSFN